MGIHAESRTMEERDFPVWLDTQQYDKQQGHAEMWLVALASASPALSACSSLSGVTNLSSHAIWLEISGQRIDHMHAMFCLMPLLRCNNQHYTMCNVHQLQLTCSTSWSSPSQQSAAAVLVCLVCCNKLHAHGASSEQF